MRGAEWPPRAMERQGLWAGGAIGREAIMVFSFRRPDGVCCRL